MRKEKTGLNRNKAFWFLIITPTILVLSSIFTDIDKDIVASYCFFCFSTITAILGTKANDTYNKFKYGDKKDDE